MHQYSSTSARKSGRQVIAMPLTGAKFASSPISSDSNTNHGLAGRRISSGAAGPNDPTWGRTLIPRPRYMRVGVSGADRALGRPLRALASPLERGRLSSPPSPRAPALFQRVIAGLLGPRG